MRNELPQYKTDYLISWDCSDADHPSVAVTRVWKGKKGLECEQLGVSLEKYGAISLLQVCEEHEARKRLEGEKIQNAREILEKSLQVPKVNKGTTEEQRELYNATVKRLAHMGVIGHTTQIITLAEEIEHYRKKIIEIEASMPHRIVKEGAPDCKGGGNSEKDIYL